MPADSNLTTAEASGKAKRQPAGAAGVAEPQAGAANCKSKKPNEDCSQKENAKPRQIQEERSDKAAANSRQINEELSSEF